MFDLFLKERLYLKGVSPQTMRYYKCVRHAFEPILAEPTRAGAMDCISQMRDRGVSPISVNCYVRGLNAYLRWLHIEHGKELIKIPKLKEEQKILQTLLADHISRIIRFIPSGINQRRAHLVALTILDTGLRASEVLGLSKEDCDLDNLVFKVLGKGNRHRLVPFSCELRKVLFRNITGIGDKRYIFGTKTNTKVSIRNLERDFGQLGRKLNVTGVRFSPHTFRHSFAVNWIRRGGDLFQLSRCLGHSSINTTAIYLKSLGIEDLAATSQRVSLLSAQR